ncbi:MAG: FAD-binding oxidoreductase [SAR324 cluster bacterium]|nr:FAD-binding oxidoreductase [SAR324 cluster bacterium]
MKHADIIIIGAGLIGTSTALNLARAGKKVFLLEKESSACHASAVNAGGVRRLNRHFEEIPISVAAMEMWPQMSALVGSDCGFRSHGQVHIAPDENSMKFLTNRVAGVESLGFFHEELVDATEIKLLVPAYKGKCKGGIVARSDGFALPAVTLKAFFKTACSQGVEAYANSKVSSITCGENGFSVQTENGGLFESEILINCSGAWGGNIAALLHEHLPIKPTALSMMVTARMPRFLKPVVGVHGRKLSFKQMDNGTVVIGGAHISFLEMNKERTTLDFKEMRISASTVQEHFPIMKTASIVRCWAGIEGITDDDLPIIGESQKTPGLFHVCGFSAHGFQLSPMIGRLVASLVQGKKPELPLDAFSVSRFKNPV